MARHVVLLRGINIGPRNRVAMPRLRELLGELGYGDVRTYVQSGNIVLESRKSPRTLERELQQHIAEEFDVDTPVIVRTRDELAEVVDRNPLGDVADEPKRYQVSFMSGELDDGVLGSLESVRVEPERFVAIGRELYAWHPAGVARSKLWTALAGKKLGVTATARNWTTVTALLEMADE
jgi:uncharacterized protein (DUF1697 family)